MSSTLAAGAGLDFTLAQQLTVIALCALTAYISHMALAVFNDGVRPFLLDFIQGRTTRSATTAVSFGLSAGFIFGLGAPDGALHRSAEPVAGLPADRHARHAGSEEVARADARRRVGRGRRLRAERRERRGTRSAGRLHDRDAADVDADPVPLHAVPGARDHQAVRPQVGRWRGWSGTRARRPHDEAVAEDVRRGAGHGRGRAAC